MTQDSAEANTEATGTADTSYEVPAAAEQTSSPDGTNSASSSEAAGPETTSISDRIKADFLKEFGDGSDDTAAATPDQSQPPAQGQDETSANPDADQKVAADDNDDDKFRIPQDVFNTLPPGVKQRIGHLNATAKKARREVAELSGKLEQANPIIERMRTLEGFVQENRIDPKNLGAAFGMMAKMAKGDYQGFLADIQPWIKAAQMAAGAAVHPDLQARVDNGDMTEEMAKQVTAERLRLARIESENKQLTAQQRTARETGQRQQVAQQMLKTVAQREAELRSHPDYASLEPALKQQMEFALKRKVPQTAEEALALVNDGGDLAQRMRPPAPAVPPKATIPQPGASQMDRGRPKPKTTKDAIMAALLDQQGGL